MVFLNAIAWATLACAVVYLGFALYVIAITPAWQINYAKVRQVYAISFPLIIVSVLWLIFG